MAAIAVCATALLTTGPAYAFGPVGTDPTSNFGAIPESCYGDGTSSACQQASIQELDQARAQLGQPPYQLPTNFTSLNPAEQAFVLTNLDRLLYNLPAVPGLTNALDQDAAAGVQADDDPQASDPAIQAYTANWGGGYPNMILSYEAWMYDDGPGSNNLDCTSTDTTGCWGHRHDILWDFSGSGLDGPLAMGAASGIDPSGTPGYAMLIGQGDSSYQPSYVYTWSEAVASGAGASTGGSGGNGSGGKGGPPASSAVRITSVSSTRNRLVVHIQAPAGTSLECALSRHTRTGWARDHYRRCGTTVTFTKLRAGRYRLHVRTSSGQLLTKVLSIR